MLAQHGEVNLYGGISALGAIKGPRGCEGFTVEKTFGFSEMKLPLLHSWVWAQVLRGVLVEKPVGEGGKRRWGLQVKVTSLFIKIVNFSACEGVTFSSNLSWAQKQAALILQASLIWCFCDLFTFSAWELHVKD